MAAQHANPKIHLIAHAIGSTRRPVLRGDDVVVLARMVLWLAILAATLTGLRAGS